MHLDGVQRIKKFNFVELKDKLPQNLFTQKWGLFSAIEEDDSK